MSESKIRILVVDDSALMRRILQNLLEMDPEIEVIGSAKDGLDALAKAKELQPDLVTLDVEMPVMDGFTCLENLQKQGTYGVVMVSSFSREGEFATIRALEQGAIDFILKPENVFNMSDEMKRSEIIDKIKVAYRNFKKAEKIRKIEKKPTERPLLTFGTGGNQLKYIIAIGVSTGGPRALSTIMPEFPADLPAAIVVVQHMPPGFTRSLAVRLNENSRLSVKEAEEDDELKPGHAYVAPGNIHFTFAEGTYPPRVRLVNGPPVGGFRPSVDGMMNSLARSRAENFIGVIMTGMGSDGSKGLQNLKQTKKNTYILAQDESTSIVYGMPRTAVELGIVDEVVPLHDIPKSIMKYMGVRR